MRSPPPAPRVYVEIADTMATESKDEQAPLVVVLTGAAGNIAYALSFMIAQGSMFGNRQVDLRLLDIPQCVDRLEATGMELVDSASRYIASTPTPSPFVPVLCSFSSLRCAQIW